MSSPLPVIATPTGFRAIYYHVEWSIYGRKYFVKNLPIDNLVDISYSFLNLKEDGTVFVADPWATGGLGGNPFTDGNGVNPQNSWDSPPIDLGQLGQFRKLLTNQNKKFNLMLSIGGWTYSKNFSPAVSTEANRNRFVSSLKAIIDFWGIFNGISIDWEYVSDNGINYGNDGNVVSPDDGKNFILLLKQLRNTFPGFTLASCCNAAPEKNHWPIEEATELLDELHVMTYDFHDGNWGEKVTAFHTNLYPSSAGKWSASEGVDFFLSRGVPSKKIFIGGALYSRGFANTTGIGQPASGGSPHKSWDEGCVDYKKLPFNGAGVEKYDEEAQSAYAYYESEKVIDTYDNVQSIKAKAEYIKKKNLGGIILWESSGDFSYDNTKSIMKALHDNLTHG